MIEISKIYWSDRKTLSVQITESGEVVVKAPRNLPMSRIEDFINEKEDWILSKINKRVNISSKFDDIINYKNC